MRLHVDGAYGGFYALLAEHDAYAAIGACDSVVVDPHKHGLQPYGCGAVLFADPGVGRFYKHDSPYTYFTSDELHLGEISLECSRAGAAAGALWLTLQAFPLERDRGLGPILAACRRAALALADRLRGSTALQLHVEPALDIVTYWPQRPRMSEIDAAADAMLHAGMAAGDDPVFLSTLRIDARRLRHPASRDRARRGLRARPALGPHEARARGVARPAARPARSARRRRVVICRLGLLVRPATARPPARRSQARGRVRREDTPRPVPPQWIGARASAPWVAAAVATASGSSCPSVCSVRGRDLRSVWRFVTALRRRGRPDRLNDRCACGARALPALRRADARKHEPMARSVELWRRAPSTRHWRWQRALMRQNRPGSCPGRRHRRRLVVRGRRPPTGPAPIGRERRSADRRCPPTARVRRRHEADRPRQAPQAQRSLSRSGHTRRRSRRPIARTERRSRPHTEHAHGPVSGPRSPLPRPPTEKTLRRCSLRGAGARRVLPAHSAASLRAARRRTRPSPRPHAKAGATHERTATTT